MMIQHQALTQHLKGTMAAVYILAGPDEYFVDEEARAIKNAFKAQHECDEKIITVLSPDDWKQFEAETNSYSLFASHNIIDVRYDKKSVDATGKKIIQNYLNSLNGQCLVIIRLANVPARQLQWLSANQSVVLITAYPLSEAAMRSWINQQLKQANYIFDQSLIDLIFNKVQGNMLACAQAVEKINLTYEPGTHIKPKDLVEQLSDQSEFQLYDLTEACLAGRSEKAITAVRKLLLVQSEYSLVLWLLTQEIRTIIQLKHIEKNSSFAKACDELRIWKQRVRFYQMASRRLSDELLQQLLLSSYQIDNLIKSGGGLSIQHLFETIVLTLCLGRKP